MQSIFQFKNRIPWWLSGVSLFIISQSFFQGQLYFEIIQSSDWSGIWLFWSGTLGAFIIPLLFSRLWHKLQLPNDNHFYPIRFPGKGGLFLFHFRRFYVGILVCSFLMALGLITYAQFISSFIGLSIATTFIFIGIILLAMMWFNNLEFQVRWDFVIMVLYFILFILLIYWIILPLKSNASPIGWSNLLPNDQAGWSHWIFYVGFQWWATQQMDGGSFETARFAGVDQEKAARKSAILATVASAISSVIIAITAYLLVQHHAASFWTGVLEWIPNPAKYFVVLLLTGMMAAQILALSNWGASLIVDSKQENVQLSKITVMILVGFAICIAFQNQSLVQVTHYIFAISAGVAPFYILRWIFPSIGPWTQVVVMLTSFMGTLFYPLLLPQDYSILQLRTEETRTLIVGSITIIAGLLSWLILPPFHPSEHWLSVIPSKRVFLLQLMQALALGIILLVVMIAIVALIL